MRKWTLFNRIVLVLGLVSSLITVLLFVLPSRETILLDVSLLSIEGLTIPGRPTDPELRAEYFYKGEKIANLWKLDVRFANHSDKTLVGKGSQRNIIPDTLVLLIDHKCRLIDKKIIKSDFTHSLRTSGQDIQLCFDQWRKGEAIEYYFYIQSMDSTFSISEVISQPAARQIIDGDIVFHLYQERKGESRLLTDIMPVRLKESLYILALLLIGIFAIAFLVLGASAPFSFFKTRNWYSAEFPRFRNFLADKYGPDSEDYTKYSLQPRRLSEKIWAEYDGEKYPSPTVDLNTSEPVPFVLTVIFFFAVGISMIVAFVDLIQMFP
jgi:hypothetical protein